jgi:hypothetical protein
MPTSKADERWHWKAESNLMDGTILLLSNIERSQDAGREIQRSRMSRHVIAAGLRYPCEAKNNIISVFAYDQSARPQMRPLRTSIKKTLDWLDVT